MPRNFTLHTKIARPVADVFAAVVERDQLREYFVSSSNSDLIEGKEVTWTWEHYGSSPITVTKVIKNERIELTLDTKAWDKTEEAYDVKVIMEFESLEDGGTLFSISEEGWRDDPASVKGSYENCGGWQETATGLKAYLIYGIDLRK